MEQQENKSFKIHSDNWNVFLSKIVKINKKAEKLGLPLVTVKEIARHHVPAKTMLDCLSTLSEEKFQVHPAYEEIEIELTGEAPYIAGWKLLGVLEHNPGFDAPILRAVPGQHIPAQYWNADCKQCDHCEVKRLRKETFVLQNVETGETKQIGRNCVADFLPGIDPKAVASMCSYYTSMDELRCGDYCFSNAFRWDEAIYPVKDILALSQAVIRNEGWVSRAMASAEFGRPSTSDYVKDILRGPVKGMSESERREFFAWVALCAPVDQDKMLADEIVAWIENELDGSSNYGHNLKTIARCGSVNWRNIGITTSAVASYHKHMHKMDEQRKENENRLNDWFGVIGERIVVDLKVRYVSHSEGGWGVTTIIGMEDSEGRDFVWFASSTRDIYNRGDKLRVTGTIRKHEEYKGRKQTQLSRCKLEIIERVDASEVREENRVQ